MQPSKLKLSNNQTCRSSLTHTDVDVIERGHPAKRTPIDASVVVVRVFSKSKRYGIRGTFKEEWASYTGRAENRGRYHRNVQDHHEGTRMGEARRFL